jgi:hypothetical protein
MDIHKLNNVSTQNLLRPGANSEKKEESKGSSLKNCVFHAPRSVVSLLFLVAPSGAQHMRDAPFHFSVFDLIDSRQDSLGAVQLVFLQIIMGYFRNESLWVTDTELLQETL